jgi:hypothetical protein
MTRHTTHFEDLAAALRAWAEGLLNTEAAVELLIGHRLWLYRDDFPEIALELGSKARRGLARYETRQMHPAVLAHRTQPPVARRPWRHLRYDHSSEIPAHSSLCSRAPRSCGKADEQNELDDQIWPPARRLQGVQRLRRDPVLAAQLICYPDHRASSGSSPDVPGSSSCPRRSSRKPVWRARSRW